VSTQRMLESLTFLLF